MLGVGIGLQAAGVLENLAGQVAFMATPAEEYIEIEFRDELRRQGELEFLGGKPEFIRVGAMDDIDMAMMTHTSSEAQYGKIAYGGTNNGIVAKHIRFLGKAAHAGGAPHAGVNALNAAMIAMSAIHAQRETYRDPRHHPDSSHHYPRRGGGEFSPGRGPHGNLCARAQCRGVFGCQRQSRPRAARWAPWRWEAAWKLLRCQAIYPFRKTPP